MRRLGPSSRTRSAIPSIRSRTILRSDSKTFDFPESYDALLLRHWSVEGTDGILDRELANAARAQRPSASSQSPAYRCVRRSLCVLRDPPRFCAFRSVRQDRSAPSSAKCRLHGRFLRWGSKWRAEREPDRERLLVLLRTLTRLPAFLDGGGGLRRNDRALWHVLDLTCPVTPESPRILLNRNAFRRHRSDRNDHGSNPNPPGNVKG
jgi:hypothetical protein